MLDANLHKIKEKLTEQHGGDEKQLEVIFSESTRMVVEAPAGYGKTTTMISRLAYLFASGKIPNPKRILGLTFSVNAALKVKREVAAKLPILLGLKDNPISLNEKVTITNYHGFCKNVLKKYGYLVSDFLRKDINLFRAVGDSEIEKHTSLRQALTASELKVLSDMDQAIKTARTPSLQQIQEYNRIVAQKMLPLEFVTHNAVIMFVLELFNSNMEVKKFYQNYYPLIVIDEFQDTNCIAWLLIENIIADQTQLLFLGDPLQRIYGFIGALPDIMSSVIEPYGMKKIALSKNYRFCNNPEMLKLDKNIRLNAETAFSVGAGTIEKASLPAFWGQTQQDEAIKVVNKVKNLIEIGNSKIALLFSRRGMNAEIVEAELLDRGIPYFYGMFKDEDITYVEFHDKCLEQFIGRFGKTQRISKKTLESFCNNIKSIYSINTDKTVSSLLHLLDALVEKVSIDYSALSPEDKYSLLVEIFENRQLKQAMEYVDSPVILTTIHGAKGLEWDYVLICDVEQWVFTFLCRDCPSKNLYNGNICKLPKAIPGEMIDLILDDLCVFYVAITRARKQAYISASGERFNASGRRFKDGKLCCLALIDGIKLVAG